MKDNIDLDKLDEYFGGRVQALALASSSSQIMYLQLRVRLLALELFRSLNKYGTLLYSICQNFYQLLFTIPCNSSKNKF